LKGFGKAVALGRNDGVCGNWKESGIGSLETTIAEEVKSER
jgi:hypothetical protein